jgi:hypothetical protein
MEVDLLEAIMLEVAFLDFIGGVLIEGNSVGGYFVRGDYV